MILPYCIPTGNLERSNCTISLSTLGMVNIFILAILSTMFHHTMVLICISLMTYHVLHFFNVIIWKKNITFANLFSELQLIFIRLFFFLILNFKSIFMYYLYKYHLLSLKILKFMCKYYGRSESVCGVWIRSAQSYPNSWKAVCTGRERHKIVTYFLLNKEIQWDLYSQIRQFVSSWVLKHKCKKMTIYVKTV